MNLLLIGVTIPQFNPPQPHQLCPNQLVPQRRTLQWPLSHARHRRPGLPQGPWNLQLPGHGNHQSHRCHPLGQSRRVGPMDCYLRRLRHPEIKARDGRQVLFGSCPAGCELPQALDRGPCQVRGDEVEGNQESLSTKNIIYRCKHVHQHQINQKCVLHHSLAHSSNDHCALYYVH